MEGVFFFLNDRSWITVEKNRKPVSSDFKVKVEIHVTSKNKNITVQTYPILHFWSGWQEEQMLLKRILCTQQGCVFVTEICR